MTTSGEGLYRAEREGQPPLLQGSRTVGWLGICVSLLVANKIEQLLIFYRRKENRSPFLRMCT